MLFLIRLRQGQFFRLFLSKATRGDITIKNVIPKHLESITAKLMEMGVVVEEGDDSVRVTVDGRTKGVI